MDSSMMDRVYDFIREYRDEQDISPTYKEIAEGCFIAKSTVEKFLIQLEADQRITRKRGVPRSIRLVSEES